VQRAGARHASATRILAGRREHSVPGAASRWRGSADRGSGGSLLAFVRDHERQLGPAASTQKVALRKCAPRGRKQAHSVTTGSASGTKAAAIPLAKRT
jgi:hypothetical protein